jgi:hypothetical protein
VYAYRDFAGKTCDAVLRGFSPAPAESGSMTIPQFLAFSIMAAAMGLFVWGRLRFRMLSGISASDPEAQVRVAAFQGAAGFGVDRGP